MDLVASIIDNMEKSFPSSSGKTKVPQRSNSQQITDECSISQVVSTDACQEPSYKCDICGKVYYLQSKFDKHKADHEKYKNDGYCPFYKPNKVQNSHLQIGDSNIKPLPNYSQNMKYIKTTTPQNFSHKCEICGKVYTNYNKLRNHKNNHKRNRKSGLHPYDKIGKIIQFKTPSLPIVNAGCESTSSSSPSVESIKLQSAASSPNMNTKINLQVVQTYTCPLCDKTFNKKKTYVNHKQNHTRNKKNGKHLFFHRLGEKVL